MRKTATTIIRYVPYARKKYKSVKNESTSYIIISKPEGEDKSIIEVLDEIKLSKHKYTNQTKCFKEISSHIPVENLSHYIDRVYIYESQSQIIIKELNPEFFYSKRYLEQIVRHFPQSSIGFYLRTKDFSNDFGDEFKLIKHGNPKIWIRSIGDGKQANDFDSKYLKETGIKKPSPDNKIESYETIKTLLEKEFKLKNLDDLVFSEVKKLTLSELKEAGFLSQKEINAIEESFIELSEKPIFSGYGWGNKIPKEIRDEHMPTLKELSNQILTLISKLISNNNYKYFKSKKSLSLKTTKGENIISLGTNGYGTKSKFNLIFSKRIDALAKELNEYYYSKKLNSINNYKNYRTISESSSNILLGEIVANNINSLISQIISVTRFLNKYILKELDCFESISYLDESLNSTRSISRMNYFSRKYPFSRTAYSTMNEIGIAIMNNNSNVDKLIDQSIDEMSNKENNLELINLLKKKYGT